MPWLKVTLWPHRKRGSVLGSQDAAALGPFEHLDFWLYFLLKKQHGHK